MATPVSFSAFPDNISEQYLTYETTLRQRQQAEKFRCESYIHRVQIFKEESEIYTVSALCFRSQSKSTEPHHVHLTVDAKRRTTTSAFCSCKAGIAGECAHLLALIFTLSSWKLQGLKDAPADAACNSMPQAWGKPRGSTIEPEPVSSIILAKPGTKTRKRKPLMANFIDNRKSKLTRTSLQQLSQDFQDSPIEYLVEGKQDLVETGKGTKLLGSALAVQIPLIQPPAEPVSGGTSCGNLDLPQTPSIIVPDHILQHHHEWTNVHVSHDEACKLERETKDQASSQKWQVQRSCRITASNFGRFMVKKADVNEKFLNSVFRGTFKSAATSYGKANEKIARQMYIKSKAVHVHDCGLVVNPEFPFLGASPDGKVCDKGTTGIMEIKCPYGIRDMTLDQALDSEKGSTLFVERVEDKVQLKKTHSYWYQVQGQLLVTGAPFCDFVTYTKQDLHIERILPDNTTMQQILQKLGDMYISHVRDYLLRK